MKKHDKDKILVEIASYCDNDLLNTINSCITQADNPERVYFSICYQSNDLDTLKELKKIKNCKIKHLSEEEAKGSCYARYLCQQMIDDEKYVFQVDSHMRFVKHWDNLIIDELLSLNDPKAIISFYPASCTEEMAALPFDDKIFDLPTKGGVMYVKGFRENDSYFPLINCVEIGMDSDKVHKRNPFISAGNFFSFSEIHKNIMHDPEMYFYGDEIPMSIRYFTNGWNNYSSGKGYVYHKYHRSNQKFPKIPNIMLDEEEIFKKLINIDGSNYDMKEYGLGSERTFKDFEDFVGIDIKNKKIYMSAENGDFENKKFKKKISYERSREYNKNNKKDNIEVIIVDLFGEYEECISSCIDNAINKKNIKFIIGTTKEINNKNSNIKKIIKFNKTTTYSKVLSQLTKYLDNNYVAIIDSSYRFIKGWDTYLCDNIKKCGKNGALTSWIWLNKDNKKDITPYINIVKEFSQFYNYLPYLKYNEDIKLFEMKHLYKTPFISDGFIFCNSNIIKNIPIDPKLNYEEHKFIYSLRLWTNGIDLYYPNTSFIYRTKSEELLNKGKNNYPVICALQGYKNYYSKQLPENYKYDIGNIRPLWEWYDFINFDYKDEKDIEL